jgi:hypothetical protein
MGSPYLSSNESIILSTNNIIVNTVPAEAILTSERLLLIDTRHTELRPQDIPFHAIETVTIGETADSDPVLSLSLVTGPGLTQPMGIVFPQPLKTRRVTERDEWAIRLKELSISATQDRGTKPLEILPPWVPGPLPEEGEATRPEEASKFRNPPLTPRKPREPAASGNRTVLVAGAIVVIVLGLVGGAYLYAPSLFGTGNGSPLPPVTPVSTTAMTTAPTPVPTTLATPAVTPAATTVAITPIPATPRLTVPGTGVWVLVKYEGAFSGFAGAPGRFREISDTGDHLYQIPARYEIVTATIQKLDNTGKVLTVGIYNEGELVKTGSVTAPKGTVNIGADLRTG